MTAKEIGELYSNGSKRGQISKELLAIDIKEHTKQEKVKLLENVSEGQTPEAVTIKVNRELEQLKKQNK